jgi:hypothetical protein
MKPVITDTIPDKKYPNMYRLQWRDGSQSVKYKDPNGPLEDGDPIGSYGMYNLSRAKDILRNYKSYIDAMKQSEAMAGNSLAGRSKTVTGELFCAG